MALGAAAVVGIASLPSQALTLGPTIVLSQQGEPLRAAIELTQLSNEEAVSLQAALAPAEVFRASGLNYAPGLDGVQVTLQKGDGRPYLQLRGKTPLQQTYVDLLVEIQWASGRILRAYTLLLEAAPPQPTEVVPAAAPAASEPATQGTSPPVAPPPSPAVQAAPAPAARAGARSVLVKYGDTAGAIAAAHALPEVTQDQMLLALLRANPDAFVDNNVNRLRSGVELALPDSAQAQATPAPEARRLIQAQYREFNAYRRQLAEGAARAEVQAAKRKAKGSVEAAPAPAPAASAGPADKLTLSKGAVQGKSSEDELSKRGNQKEADERSAELEKSLSELRKLSAELSQQASAPVAAPASSAASAGTAPAEAASAPASAPLPQPPASEASTPAVAGPAAQASSSALLDTLLANPLVPALAGGLVALLAALGLYRARRRRPADSPLAAAEAPVFVPPSPIEPPVAVEPEPPAPAPIPEPEPEPEMPREIDPVSEADVYLAYGREDQAVAVLQDGLLAQPDRMAIHMKLLDIYAKQLNTEPFEQAAREVQRLTGGQGPDWEHACDLGRSIDPYNPLYQPPGEAPPTSDDDWAAALAEAAPPAEPPRSELDLDLSQAVAPSAPQGADLDSDIDLDLDTQQTPPPAPAEPARPVIEEPPAAPPSPAAPLDFDLSSINLDLGGAQEPPPPPSDDPLAVKLALAEEFSAIGDTDGARSLLEEVIAEASGEIRAKAEEALNKLK